ncbi:MAG: hypothetical protein J7K75_12615 [Desulfuromonas sp.]|nr:hypothetical protein [Desulfuromonas sp.]
MPRKKQILTKQPNYSTPQPCKRIKSVGLKVRLAAKVKHDGKRLIVGGFATPGGQGFKAISLHPFFGALQRNGVGCGTKPANLTLTVECSFKQLVLSLLHHVISD